MGRHTQFKAAQGILWYIPVILPWGMFDLSGMHSALIGTSSKGQGYKGTVRNTHRACQWC